MSTQEMQCEHPFCVCCWTAGSIMESQLAEARAENERLGNVVSMYTDVLIAKDTSITELEADVVWVARRTDRWGGLLTVDDSEVLAQARSARRRAVRGARNGVS